MFWGILIDMFNGKPLLLIITSAFSVLNFTLPLVLDYKYLFPIWYLSIGFFSSGVITIIFASYSKVYGTLVGGYLIGIAYTARSFSVIAAMVFPYLFTKIDLPYSQQILVFAVFTTSALITTCFYKEKVLIKDIKKVDGLIFPMIIPEKETLKDNESLLDHAESVTTKDSEYE